MEFSAKQIAEFLKGDIEGDQNVNVSNFSKIEEGTAGTISFLSNPKYEAYLYTTNASIVLVSKSFQLQKSTKATLIRVEDPYQSLAMLLTLYSNSKPKKTGINKNTHIADSAKIGNDVYIDAFTSIGENTTIGNGVRICSNCNIGDNVTIGDNTIVYGGVSIYEDCKIGESCILQAGCVVGSDGFGFAPQQGDYAKIPQIGNVVIEDYVEIGANTVIDRATMGSTIIRKGVKLDNLIQIAHNVEVGDNTVIAAQTGIAGSTTIGKNCMFGGQIGVSGHIIIADETKIGAQAGIANNIKTSGKILLGSPAIDIVAYRKAYAVFKGLPEMSKTLFKLEKEFKALNNKLENE